jgi:hypothetical protein
MAPSLEVVTAPVELDVDDLAADDIVATGGTVEGGFGDVVDPLTDGLRMIRALGGIVMA